MLTTSKILSVLVSGNLTVTCIEEPSDVGSEAKNAKSKKQIKVESIKMKKKSSSKKPVQESKSVKEENARKSVKESESTKSTKKSDSRKRASEKKGQDKTSKSRKSKSENANSSKESNSDKKSKSRKSRSKKKTETKSKSKESNLSEKRTKDLKETAEAIVPPGKGILAADESTALICKKFEVDNDALRKMMALILDEMNKGLSKDEWESSSIKMLPSFVMGLPNGRERGNFLALDLGGTNFRVLLIKLEGLRSDMKSKIFIIPESIMVGSGKQLFDHIITCLADFIHESHLSTEHLALGFTFSFPLQQKGLTSGTLISWTKGFKCTGVEGEDVVKLLQEAAARRKDVSIDVVAILNDTVGTLMSLGYTDTECRIGVIIGTGTNACYVEKLSRCPKLEEFMNSPDDEMVINTEWGAFGDGGLLKFILNEYDANIDSNSINPGKQTFEKAISGMYIGELLRLALEDLAKKGALFAGKDIKKLCERNAISTKDISKIDYDRQISGSLFTKTRAVLAKLQLFDVSDKECQVVSKICEAVSTRSAYLCGAAIAVLLNRIKKPSVTVGVDGSVFRFHPFFKKLLDQKISELIDRGLQFKLKLSEDGSGRGAALVAAVAGRLKEGA